MRVRALLGINGYVVVVEGRAGASFETDPEATSLSLPPSFPPLCSWVTMRCEWASLMPRLGSIFNRNLLFEAGYIGFVIKLGGADDRFGDYLSSSRANCGLAKNNGRNQVTIITFTIPKNNISKSILSCIMHLSMGTGGLTILRECASMAARAVHRLVFRCLASLRPKPDLLLPFISRTVSSCWQDGREEERKMEGVSSRARSS